MVSGSSIIRWASSRWICLFSDKRSTLELTEIAERQFKDRLQTVTGVGGVNFGGEKRQAIRVRLDAMKMAAHEITASDLIKVFHDNSVELPSGRLENYEREMSVRTLGKLNRPEQFEEMVIAFRGGAPVRLHEVAKVELGVEDERTVARWNRRPCVGLGIVKQSEANALEVAERVKAEAEKIKPLLPRDIQVEVAYDSSTFVRRAISEVQHTILIAFTLVLLIMLAFLRNFRSTLIPMIAVPVSLIGTFLILNVCGFSVNILTLLALVLAVGVVVDDAIVVLENIFRHIEAGMRPLDAAISLGWIRRDPAGRVTLRLEGTSGRSYRVDVSEDLRAWQTVATVTNLDGTVSFTDPPSLTRPQRFYRAVFQP